MLPLLSYQKLTNHIDGTTAPSATITSGDQSIPNPAFTTWNDFDQRAVILLNSSLTEEAAAEVLGLTTAHAIWTALETAYSNSSVERIHSLRDSLRKLSIWHLHDENGQASLRTWGRRPHLTASYVAPLGLCLSCPSINLCSNDATSDANLAQAFTSQCHVTQGHPDWYVDSGATAHMTSSPDNVSHSAPYSGNMRVFLGNGDALPVSHIGQSMVSNKILLRDVLVIPKLTKNLLTEKQKVISTRLCVRCAYVLRDTPMALAATVGVSRKASFELWHNRLGHVRKFFKDNGTLHRLSCPYTPQQNGRAERKHRHLVETGLAMLFHAHVPASYWLCTFLEDGPPISDAPVPESRPTDTRPSSSSPCGLCPVPTTAAEPIHEPDSTPSSPYSSEDDNPPTDSDDVSSHGAPPATAPTEPSKGIHNPQLNILNGLVLCIDEMEAFKTILYLDPCTSSSDSTIVGSK
ncbi:zinc finger, CCHC-type containing LTR copia-type gag-polypeptide [Tanacetum coccineum]